MPKKKSTAYKTLKKRGFVDRPRFKIIVEYESDQKKDYQNMLKDLVLDLGKEMTKLKFKKS